MNLLGLHPLQMDFKHFKSFQSFKTTFTWKRSENNKNDFTLADYLELN